MVRRTFSNLHICQSNSGRRGRKKESNDGISVVTDHPMVKFSGDSVMKERGRGKWKRREGEKIKICVLSELCEHVCVYVYVEVCVNILYERIINPLLYL